MEFLKTTCSIVRHTSDPEVVTVDVLQAKELLLSGGYRYLDVRVAEDYNKGHVDTQNIMNIPYMFTTPQGRVKNPKFLEEVLSVCNKDDKLVVGCNSGGRSLRASVELVNAEFKNVNNMGGGFTAWAENGLLVKCEET